MVKNQPAKLETRVGSLGWEDPLEKEMLAWKISQPKGSWLATAHAVARVRHD